jgi:hypothetical protein
MEQPPRFKLRLFDALAPRKQRLQQNGERGIAKAFALNTADTDIATF